MERSKSQPSLDQRSRNFKDEYKYINESLFGQRTFRREKTPTVQSRFKPEEDISYKLKQASVRATQLYLSKVLGCEKRSEVPSSNSQRRKIDISIKEHKDKILRQTHSRQTFDTPNENGITY